MLIATASLPPSLFEMPNSQTWLNFELNMHNYGEWSTDIDKLRPKKCFCRNLICLEKENHMLHSYQNFNNKVFLCIIYLILSSI